MHVRLSLVDHHGTLHELERPPQASRFDLSQCNAFCFSATLSLCSIAFVKLPRPRDRSHRDDLSPSRNTRLPSDQAHHIDCMLSLSSIHVWLFDLFDVARSRPLPPLLWNLFDVVSCCSFFVASRSPIIASCSALSSVAYFKSCSSRRSSVSDSVLLTVRKGVKVITRTARLVTGRRST